MQYCGCHELDGGDIRWVHQVSATFRPVLGTLTPRIGIALVVRIVTLSRGADESVVMVVEGEWRKNYGVPSVSKVMKSTLNFFHTFSKY